MGPIVFKYPSASREQDREQQQSGRAADMGSGEAQGHCLFIRKFGRDRNRSSLGRTAERFAPGLPRPSQTFCRRASSAILAGCLIRPSHDRALALFEGQKPKDEVDAAIAMQMACAHGASMMLLARFGGGGGGDRRVQALAHATARLINAFSNAAETLRKRQNGSSQYMRIEHVHVGDGGQAVIGNVQRAKPSDE